jgi:hypothetical protein
MPRSYKEFLEGKHSYPQILFATEWEKKLESFLNEKPEVRRL